MPGPVRLVEQGGEEQVFYASGGFLEVQRDVVTILADTALRAADVDEAAAEEARKSAEEALANQSGELDYGRASAQLAEAAAQLATLRKLKPGQGEADRSSSKNRHPGGFFVFYSPLAMMQLALEGDVVSSEDPKLELYWPRARVAYALPQAQGPASAGGQATA